MTFQTAQIQSMIAEIDAVLNQTSRSPLGWLTSRESAQQRWVLERVRTNLQTLQKQLATAAAAPGRTEPNRPTSERTSHREEAQFAQGARVAASQRLQADVEALRQQRESLIQEIQQLEQQRQNYLSPQKQSTSQEPIIAEFLQALMSSLQENLTPQISETLSHLEAQFSTDKAIEALSGTSPHDPTTEFTLPLNPQARNEQLLLQQAKMARLLKTLDAKLGLMFETLQVNLHKYQSSFSQGLEKMNRLSEQSEAMLTQLIDQLEQELEPEAADNPQPQQLGGASASTSKTGQETTAPKTPAQMGPQTKPIVSDDLPFPYAGVEWIPSLVKPQATSALTESSEVAVAPSQDSTDSATVLETGTINPPTLSGGMAGLVGQTNIVSPAETEPQIPLIPPLEPDESKIDELENVDAIASLTDLIETPSNNNAPSAPESAGLTPPSPLEDVPLIDQIQEQPFKLGSELLEFHEPAESLQSTDDLTPIAAEEIEATTAISDDVLAEFDELFGLLGEDATPPASEVKADLTQPDDIDQLEPPETEKKKLAATEKLQKAIDRENGSSKGQEISYPPLIPSSPRFWYLGIDFGTTGLSAVLLNAKTRQMYPISWSVAGQMEGTEPLFRIPTGVYWKPGESLTPTYLMAPETIEIERGILLKNFKPLLKLGLPYHDSQTDNWEPVLQWSEQQSVSLYWFKQALQTLLATLKPGYQEQGQPLSLDTIGELGSEAQDQESHQDLPITHYPLPISAVGLEPEAFSAALEELAGVITSCPADWCEAYRFNVREAVLQAGLVESPDRVCFVEEAIASVIAQLQKAKVAYQGETLIIHAGAATTELGLVDLPENLADLTSSHFACRSFAYAGNAIDQDIICQMLLHPEYKTDNLSLNTQPFEPVQENRPRSNDLELPLPGEPDLRIRYRLQRHLESPLGQMLLEAAKHLKLILQDQDGFTLELEEYRWVLQRQDLENRIYQPFIQSLNRELNALLVRQGIAVEAIRQVICTGGTAQIGAIAHWLRQKLPNATLIQSEATEPSQSTLSQVALGLAALPLYPQVLDAPRHQYSDYFLLLELLRIFGDQPLSVGTITQLLERRGINTSACQRRLLAFLEGYLPPGMVISELDASLMTQESRQNAVTQDLEQAPLFYKEDNQTYRLNGEQSDRVQDYFKAVLVQSRQQLEEPYGLNWVAPVLNSGGSSDTSL